MDREVFQERFGLIGESAALKQVIDKVIQVADTDITILLEGESGVGKDITARAIHGVSQRKHNDLVIVNCGAIPEGIIESELFGHEKGSFTGAHESREGYFEKANGGTIFLDEIGDITPKLQAELLRVLDSGEFKPVGGNATSKVDVRLIAATNRDLEQGIEEGWFREDLFYRLNVFTITMPPLRSRIESIPELVHHFLARASRRLNKPIVGVEDRAIAAMMRYRWPGNIRELQNIIERASVLAQDEVIRLENLPTVFAELALAGTAPRQESGLRAQRDRHVNVVERNLLKRYLEEARGNVSEAARISNIPRRTFYRLLTRHRLKGQDFKNK